MCTKMSWICMTAVVMIEMMSLMAMKMDGNKDIGQAHRLFSHRMS